MTKANREKLYAHLRDEEKNYEARAELNSGPTATQTVRKRAKDAADEILKKHPELEVKPESVKTEPKEAEEAAKKGLIKEEKTNSKKKGKVK